MRQLVIGDIHGGLKALVQLMERAEVGSQDKLIFLGDYVDGWSDAVETVNFLIELKSTHNCLFLKGNHDELCENWLLTEKDNPLWLSNGGQATLDSYRGVGEEYKKVHLSFFGALENYHLDDDSRLFLHAGFTNLKGVGHEYFSKNFYWDRTLWELALALDPRKKASDATYPNRLTHYSEIYIGHTPVTKIGLTTPHKAANVWNIDTGAGFKGPLTMIDINTKEFWQSDPVYKLYPGERGRN